MVAPTGTQDKFQTTNYQLQITNSERGWLLADLAEDALERVVAGVEGPQQGGVELTRRAAQDHADRCRVADRRLVEALAAQGVVDVGDSDQPRRRRDGIASQLVGIALAV